jgi:hypothetical protein
MKTVRLLVVLSCVALLVFGSMSAGISQNTAKASADQVTVTEKEPNNDPMHAQAVPFPQAGQSVVVQGRVQAGDMGGFSEELETFFGGVGAINDWYVADPDTLTNPGNGPFALTISVGWQGSTDVDVWVGTTVDDASFFFDGFKLLNDVRTATLANPESWPRSGASTESVALYLQPSGVKIGTPPMTIANNGFGRKLMIGIQHFEGPPADYTLTIQRRDFASELHQVDDGGITAGFFRLDPGTLVVNCFRPTRYPATLTAIGHPFVQFSTTPDPTGKPLRVVAVGAANEGNAPPDMTTVTPLFDKTLPVPGNISPMPGQRFLGRVNNFTLDPPVTINSGVVYVGLQYPTAPIEQTGIAFALDTSPVQYVRTFFSTDGGKTWSLRGRTEDVSGQTVILNADIRAIFTYGGGVTAARSDSNRSHDPVVKVAPAEQTLEIRPVNR